MIILGLGMPFSISIRTPNPWSIDLKKLIVILVVKKFTAFYGTKSLPLIPMPNLCGLPHTNHANTMTISI
jgi:hypothetical protein